MPRRTQKLWSAVVFATLSFGSAHAAAADKPKPGAAAPAATSTPAGAAAAPEKSAPEKGIQGQPKAGTTGSSANVVSTEESKEGVKTYKFGAVEVEGRLRSPQLIYFLRRVRAEFLAGDLGHRSFLRELSDTARQSTFR